MVKTEAEKREKKELVKNGRRGSAASLKIPDLLDQGRKVTNNRAQLHRVKGPRVRPHISRGKEYYYHITGRHEIYLGSADYLRSLVLKDRAEREAILNDTGSWGGI